MKKLELEPEIVIHNKFEKPLSSFSNHCYGQYVSKDNAVHILNKDLLFNLVLEHELWHHKRCNIWYVRLCYSKFFQILEILPFVLWLLSLRLFGSETFISYLLLTIGVCLLFSTSFVGWYEEKICEQNAWKIINVKTGVK